MRNIKPISPATSIITPGRRNPQPGVFVGAAMFNVTYTWRGDGLVRLTVAAKNLKPGKARAAFRRGINRAGDKTFTATRRAVAKQVGLSQKQATAKGGLRKVRANYSRLEYLIVWGKVMYPNRFRDRIIKLLADGGTAA